MRTCPQRPLAFDTYKNQIPNLINCFDDFDKQTHGNTSMFNMKKALCMAIEQNTPSVFLEDDIILCDNFYNKIIEEINTRPSDLIQFFSMRKDDFIIGSRYIAGSKFLMNQCFYAPLSIIEKIYECYDEFENIRTDNRIGGTDSWVQYALKKHKFKYWNVVPNLVEHKVCVSAIDKRRSSKRQSFTFQK
jgi:hypothetical protein